MKREKGNIDWRFISEGFINELYVKKYNIILEKGDEISFKIRAMNKYNGISILPMALIAIAKRQKI